MKGVGKWVLATAVLAAAGVGWAATYTVTDLGPGSALPDPNESPVIGINSRGCVAATLVTNNTCRAQLYTGTWTSLGTLGGSDSYAGGINGSNCVVGHSLAAGGLNHAFLWIPSGTNGIASNPQMKDLGTLGGNVSEAYDINASGGIAGTAQNSAGEEHAVRWSGGVMTDIGALLTSAFTYSFGYGINLAGQVVGTAYDSKYNNRRAFLYNGTNAAALGGFSAGVGVSEAFAINDSGMIVGYADYSGFYHAFCYRTNQVTDLGTLGQGTFSQASAINNSNVVVGTATVDAGGNILHAFIAKDNTMTDLNDLLDETGTGWTLEAGNGINDSGQIIGIGTTNGQKHIFLLSPIRPVVTALNIRGVAVQLSFTTITNATYFLESRTNFLTGNWSNLPGNIAGTGGTLTLTNLGGATNASRYYRVRITVP